ncbi:MAG: heavy metal translocating P-type ATPase metal-binding domain-containing protein, partial [Planctomycetes bacterium]|nr:heavy metal translocating P-type ATPase metal-binding domain-containing protein [Planctomycetota bacterium]
MTDTFVDHRGSRTASQCRHCGLPVPKDPLQEGFCCSGCAAVHRLLHDAELDRFYDLGGGRGRPIGQPFVPRTRDWLDASTSTEGVAGLERLDVDVQGIHCAACVWLLQEHWHRREGTIDIQLNPSIGRIRLVYDPARLDIAEYLDACESLGYRIGPAGKGDSSAERDLLVR